MKCKLKRKSKRIPTNVRMKAEKKVREHNRKVRKEQKQNPGKYARKANKAISVPNDCPFKETVLKEVEEARKRKEAEKAQRRIKLAEAAKTKAGQRVHGEGDGLAEIVRLAEKKGGEFEEELEEDENEDLGAAASQERSAKTYYKEFSKVVESADVILQVLDARDPLGTRCQEVEDLVVTQGGKRVVLVLTKADLVPKENLLAWIKYLRQQLPTVAFKSSTQNQARRLGHARGKMAKMTDEQMQTSKSVGISTLMALLANYCRNKDVKSAIRVGVVGYPNVGKSSLINSLKRGKVCNTGNTPGVTKVMQEVQLDGKIKLLDCPGMVLNTSKSSKDDVQVALRNAMKTDQLADYVVPVEAILQRCEKQYLQLQYNIADFSSSQEFLFLVAKAKGKLKRGGLPDPEAAAKLVINDWTSGKIKYFTHPPEKQTTVMDSKIVEAYSKEFDLADLEERMEADSQLMKDVLPSETTVLMDTADDDQIPKVSVVKQQMSKKTKDKLDEAVVKLGPNAPPKLKKAQKMREKKERKDRKRRDKLGDELSEIMNAAI